jgi:hypothetical protein
LFECQDLRGGLRSASKSHLGDSGGGGGGAAEEHGECCQDDTGLKFEGGLHICGAEAQRVARYIDGITLQLTD